MVEIVKPFPPQCWPRVWTWVQEFRHLVADDFAPRTVGEFVERQLADRSMTWAVYRDGDLGGLIAFQPWSSWVGAAHCIFRRDFWGAAVTDAAIQKCLEQIWEAGYGKIVMHPFRRNGQVRALLHRIGAQKEGVLRGQTLCDGKPVDMVAYALFREVHSNAATGDRAGDGDQQLGGSGLVDCGLGSVGTERNEHQQHHADTVS